MDSFIVLMIAATFVVVGITTIAIVIGSIAIKYYQTKELELKLQRDEIKYKSEHRNRQESLRYSEDMLDFIKLVVAQVSVIQFRKFTDGHKMEKVTLAQVKNIVSEIAGTVNKAIIRDNIEFDTTIFTREFFDSYIIETTSMFVKQLLEKYIIDVIDG